MAEFNQEKRQIKRRDFLRGMAMVGVGLSGASLISACAPAAPAAPAVEGAAAPTTDEVVSLTWFVRDDPLVNPWEDKIVAEFGDENPNIQVEWISGGRGAEREAKFTAMIAGGTPPDVFSSWQEAGFGDYAARKLMLDLQPYLDVTDDLDLSSIPENLLNTYAQAGELLAIPFASGASYLFYNKTAFDEADMPYPTTNWDDPNWTWDAMIEMARQLTKDYGTPDAQYGVNQGLWPSNAIQWLFDADLFPEDAYDDGFYAESPADSENSILAYQSQADLMWVEEIAPTPSLTGAMEAVGDPFKTGKIVMQMTGVWGFWSYSDITAFELGAAALPVGRGYNKPVIFTDPWMIARETQYPDQAWEFAKMLVDPKRGAKDYMELTGVVPPAAELLPLWYEQIGNRMPWLTPEQLTELVVGSLAHGFESANHLLVNFNQMNSMVNAEREAIFLNNSTAAEVMPIIKEKLDVIAADTLKQFDKA